MDLLEDQIKKHENFHYFVTNSFSKGLVSSGLTGIDPDTRKPRKFIDGKFLEDICKYLQNNYWTMRIGPRDHFKSLSFYAHFCWTLYRNKGVNLDCYYMSFKTNLAEKHIADIKKIIRHIPDFEELVDLKPNAETVASYTWDGGKTHITITPGGILEFKRGLHMKGPLYLDDPLKDPTQKLDPTTIKKINSILELELLSMPHGEFHICGTPQTNIDFFFNENLVLKANEKWNRNLTKFRRLIQPAILDWKKKIVLFPEHRPWDWLMSKLDTMKDKKFNQEFMCSPAYEQDSYFEREQLYAVVNEELENVDISSNRKTNKDIIAGYDIGKKTHPAHFVVFEVTEGKTRKYTQLYQKFFDNTDYIKQIEHLTNVCKALKIDIVYYDNTRGELEALDEQGNLPESFEPVVFSSKVKNALATVFYKKVCDKEIELINDQRQINQILAVNNDLDAMETEEGHGDSFWSVCLALADESEVA